MATATEEFTEIVVEAIEEEGAEVVRDAGLFDPEPYDRPVPRVDGTPADGIELVFSGKVVLDPENDDDLALLERLKLDSDATMRVEVAVAGKAMKIRRGEDETTATHGIALRVHTLYREGEVSE